MEGLAGEVVVEVHHDSVFADLRDPGIFDMAVLVVHRQPAADLEQIFADLSVDLEGAAGEFDDPRGIVLPVPFGRRDFKSEGAARLQTLDLGFKAGNEHLHAVNVVQRLLFRGHVDDLSVHGEFVAHLHDFVFSYFHFSIACYLFSTFLLILPLGPDGARKMKTLPCPLPFPSPRERGTGAEAPGLRLIIIRLFSTFLLIIPLGKDRAVQALKSTLRKASDGTCRAVQGRASSPTATRLFHKSFILPVMTISCTGADTFPFLKAMPSMP